jgi:predicted house-cleaning noncanonical NTP pyrophosphatase (MazG superfamily)
MIRKYNKLVRDKIPKKLTNKNIKFAIRKTKDTEEYVKFLLLKLEEEIGEFQCTYTKAEELADIIEVVEALRKVFPEVDEIRKKKFEQVGGFEKGIILETTEE